MIEIFECPISEKSLKIEILIFGNGVGGQEVNCWDSSWIG